MKTQNIVLFGGLGVLAYALFKNKKETPIVPSGNDTITEEEIFIEKEDDDYLKKQKEYEEMLLREKLLQEKLQEKLLQEKLLQEKLLQEKLLQEQNQHNDISIYDEQNPNTATYKIDPVVTDQPLITIVPTTNVPTKPFEVVTVPTGTNTVYSSKVPPATVVPTAVNVPTQTYVSPAPVYSTPQTKSEVATYVPTTSTSVQSTSKVVPSSVREQSSIVTVKNISGHDVMVRPNLGTANFAANRVIYKNENGATKVYSIGRNNLLYRHKSFGFHRVSI